MKLTRRGRESERRKVCTWWFWFTMSMNSITAGSAYKTVSDQQYTIMINFIKLKSFFLELLNSSATRNGNRLIKYFNERSTSGSINLKEYADISSPLPEHLNDYEAVGALVAYLLSENTPTPIMIERHPIHDSWMNRFDESFFLIAEEVARDFQIMGYTPIALRLLGYCQRISGIVGRHEYEERFEERKKSIYRGRSRRRGGMILW